MRYYLAKAIQNIIPHSKVSSLWTSVSSSNFNGRTSNNGTTSAVAIEDNFQDSANFAAIIVTSYYAGGSTVYLSFSVGKEDSTALPRIELAFHNNSLSEYNVFRFSKTTGDVSSHSQQSTTFLPTATENGSYWDFSITAKSFDPGMDRFAFGVYPAAFLPSSPGIFTTSATGLTVIDMVYASVNSPGLFLATSGTAVGSLNDFVQVFPEYNYEITGKKIEDRKRARSGREYVYKWGQFEGRKFDVSYVSNSDKTKINSWWSGNDSLLFIEGLTTAVTSVRIQNDKTPINKLEKPYSDLWKGTIELETY